MGRTRFLLILDIMLLVLVVALQAVAFTGLVGHEWIGVAFAVPLFVHLLFQWQWIRSTWERAMAQKQHRAQFNFLLNTLLFIVMTLAIFSGVMASEVVRPALGLAAGRHEPWADLHVVLADALVGLVGLHVALNWRWIVTALRVHLLRSPAVRRDPVILTTEPEDTP